MLIYFVLTRIVWINFYKPEKNIPTLQWAYYNNFIQAYNTVNSIQPIDMPTLWTSEEYLNKRLTNCVIPKWKVKVNYTVFKNNISNRFFWTDNSNFSKDISKEVDKVISALNKINNY